MVPAQAASLAVLRKRPVLLVRRPEAQGGPGVVDGYLPDRLHALIGQGGDEPVAVQVGAELAAAHPQTVDAVFRKILRQPHFTWADHGEALTHHGYNLRHWEEGDLGFWAVTDAAPSELTEFERLFRAATKG